MNSNNCSKVHLRKMIMPLLKPQLCNISGIVDIISNYVRGDLLLVFDQKNTISTLDPNEDTPIVESTAAPAKLLDAHIPIFKRFCVVHNYLVVARLNNVANGFEIIDLNTGRIREALQMNIINIKYIPWSHEIIILSENQKTYKVAANRFLSNPKRAIWQPQFELRSNVQHAQFGVDTKEKQIYMFLHEKGHDNIKVSRYHPASDKWFNTKHRYPLSVYNKSSCEVLYICQWNGFIITGMTEDWVYKTQFFPVKETSRTYVVYQDPESHFTHVVNNCLIRNNERGSWFKIDLMTSQSPAEFVQMSKLKRPYDGVEINCPESFLLPVMY